MIQRRRRECVHRNNQGLARFDEILKYWLGSEISHSGIHQALAVLSGHKQTPHDGVAIESSEALCAPNRAAFDETFERLFSQFQIHVEHISRKFFVRFTESDRAGLAAPTLMRRLPKYPNFLQVWC